MDKLGLGRKMERLVMARWVRDGYECWQPPRSKYSSQDLFGLFDFIALKPNNAVHLVQVKRHRVKEEETALDAIEAFCRSMSTPTLCSLVAWRRKGGMLQFQAKSYTLTGWDDTGDWTEAME